MPEKPKPESRGAAWLIPLIIFTCAFVIRMAFVAQVKDSPYWRVPLVDAQMYDQAAREMLDVSWLAPLPKMAGHFTPYYQPPLYQAFLALIYLVFGRSVMAAIIVQYLIGSLCCVLTYFVAARFFDRRIGIAAGIAMALTATEIYYEGRLLPPVLLIFLNLAILLLAAKQIEKPVAWRWPVIGLLIGLSAITRPDILLFLPFLLLWMWIERRTLLPERPLVWTLILLLLAAVPVGLTTLRNALIGKDTVPISWNGGVNFFIGNNPSMEKTIAIRPGTRWEALINEPMIRLRTSRPSDWSRYYLKIGLSTMWKFKRVTVFNLARKFLWVWRGPEIRRNEDEYYLRRVSSLYRMLLWRSGNFGFPFGVIAPLGLLGMVMSFRRRRELFLPYAYVVTQALMLVMFFPCTRYRAPLVPVLLMFGAAAVLKLISLARRKETNDLFMALSLLLIFGAVSTLSPPSFEGTPAQIEAENHRLLATALYAEGRQNEALRTCEDGLRLNPHDADIQKWLMEAYLEIGDYPNAEKHALECTRLAPTYGPAYATLVKIYEAEGKKSKAREIERLIKTYGQAPSWK